MSTPTLPLPSGWIDTGVDVYYTIQGSVQFNVSYFNQGRALQGWGALSGGELLATTGGLFPWQVYSYACLSVSPTPAYHSGTIGQQEDTQHGSYALGIALNGPTGNGRIFPSGVSQYSIASISIPPPADSGTTTPNTSSGTYSSPKFDYSEKGGPFQLAVSYFLTPPPHPAENPEFAQVDYTLQYALFADDRTLIQAIFGPVSSDYYYYLNLGVANVDPPPTAVSAPLYSVGQQYALLDFGALVCTARAPRCSICPFSKSGQCDFYLGMMRDSGTEPASLRGELQDEGSTGKVSDGRQLD